MALTLKVSATKLDGENFNLALVSTMAAQPI